MRCSWIVEALLDVTGGVAPPCCGIGGCRSFARRRAARAARAPLRRAHGSPAPAGPAAPGFGPGPVAFARRARSGSKSERRARYDAYCSRRIENLLQFPAHLRRRIRFRKKCLHAEPRNPLRSRGIGIGADHDDRRGRQAACPRGSRRIISNPSMRGMFRSVTMRRTAGSRASRMRSASAAGRRQQHGQAGNPRESDFQRRRAVLRVLHDQDGRSSAAAFRYCPASHAP